MYRSPGEQLQHLRSVDDSTCDFPPPNDSYENAQAIACDLILTGSLQNANGDEYNGTTVLGNGISNSGAIWYEFNADQDYQVTFNTCASADADNGVTDTDVIVFAVGTDGSLTAIATNDDSGIAGCGSGTTGTFNSIVSINAEQGNNYLVRVGHFSSFSSQTGIAIEANCAPIVLGCTDPAYAEFDASANADDGSCATLNPTCVEPSFDGYSYSVVEIGDQCWFAENLRTTVYGNGDAIPAGLTDGRVDDRPLRAPLRFTARAAARATTTVLTSMPATRRSPWRSMAACTIGMLWMMRVACARADGMSRPMESGRIWRTSSRHKASAERREQL